VKYVSCRVGFDSVDGAPVANAAWFGKPVLEGQEFIFTHGYNSVGEQVRDYYRANAEVMRETGITIPPVGWLWPGLGGNWVEAAEFHRAQAQADLSAFKFADYLNGQEAAVVMAHSLGAKVVLEAVIKHGAKIKLLVLIGAAVDASCFTTDYAAANKTVQKVHVFYSQRDEVLGRAFMLDQVFTHALGHDGPVGVCPPWVVATDVTDAVGSHSGYRFDRVIWKAIKADIE
jgi:pimeloyl-ACP methyl ester carboxylesterase